MTNKAIVSLLFAAAAFYEGALGLLFLLAASQIFHWAGVPPPNHFGYVQFPAALLLVFAWMFVNIARDPVRNRALIPYGTMLKASYCALVFYYWAKEGVPNMWKPFAVADLVFLLLFGWAYQRLGETTALEPTGEPGVPAAS